MHRVQGALTCHPTNPQSIDLLSCLFVGHISGSLSQNYWNYYLQQWMATTLGWKIL